MLISKAAPVFRQVIFKPSMKKIGQFTVPVRNSGGGGFVYRNRPEPDPVMVRLADICGTFGWWWIFYHLMTQYDHIIGEFEYPDTSRWTDEELGIPPDDYDPNNA